MRKPTEKPAQHKDSTDTDIDDSYVCSQLRSLASRRNKKIEKFARELKNPPPSQIVSIY